jgi:two-component sensor histidine kinase/PAS domain-containing protein
MGIVGDVCRKTAALDAEQIEALENIADALQIAADVAHAQVTVYTRAREAGFLVIIAQAKPHTSFIQYRPNLLGTTVSAAEEPLIWRTMTTGEHISGEREWALGMEVLAMQTFSVPDASGRNAAAVSFEYGIDDEASGDHDILIETAYQFLTSARVAAGTVYRPLSAREGIIIVDDRGRVVYANAAAASIYKLFGVGRIVGRRVYDRQVNIRLAVKAASTRQPQESELEIGGVVSRPARHPRRPRRPDGAHHTYCCRRHGNQEKRKELLIKSAVISGNPPPCKKQPPDYRQPSQAAGAPHTLRRSQGGPARSVNRILSISVVHEFLSSRTLNSSISPRSPKTSSTSSSKICSSPTSTSRRSSTARRTVLPSDQAISLALAINELIQNSIEHGFVGRREGVIGVEIAALKNAYQIDIWDNGIGLPPDFGLKETNSLGLQIIKTLIENDLGGTFRLYSKNGTRATIVVPFTTEGG